MECFVLRVTDWESNIIIGVFSSLENTVDYVRRNCITRVDEVKPSPSDKGWRDIEFSFVNIGMVERGAADNFTRYDTGSDVIIDHWKDNRKIAWWSMNDKSGLYKKPRLYDGC